MSNSKWEGPGVVVLLTGQPCGVEATMSVRDGGIVDIQVNGEYSFELSAESLDRLQRGSVHVRVREPEAQKPPVAPGYRLMVLREVEKLVSQHQLGESELSGEAILERIGELVLDCQRPLDRKAVLASLERMQSSVNEGDHEAAHGEQVRLYERMLEELAAKGDELAPHVLKARVIVRRWE